MNEGEKKGMKKTMKEKKEQRKGTEEKVGKEGIKER